MVWQRQTDPASSSTICSAVQRLPRSRDAHAIIHALIKQVKRKEKFALFSDQNGSLLPKGGSPSNRCPPQSIEEQQSGVHLMVYLSLNAKA